MTLDEVMTALKARGPWKPKDKAASDGETASDDKNGEGGNDG